MFVFQTGSLAAEPVSIIYVHGVNAFDTQEVYDEANALNEAFRGKKLAEDYYFNGRHEVVIWSDLLNTDKAYSIYQSGLKSLNTANNRSKVKNTTEFDLKLLNPFLPFVLVNDSGSGGWSAYTRNVVNDFLYQVAAIENSAEKRAILRARIQSAVDKTNGKYVILAHSYGSVAALDYIEKFVMTGEKNSDKFAGLITSADMNTTLNAEHWAEILCDKTCRNVFEYFIEEGKFWICYNHRNDIAAINLPPEIINNTPGSGFVVSETTKSNYLRRQNPFGYDNGKISAHLWMVRQQKDFAKKVVDSYNKNKLP